MDNNRFRRYRTEDRYGVIKSWILAASWPECYAVGVALGVVLFIILQII